MEVNIVKLKEKPAEAGLLFEFLALNAGNKTSQRKAKTESSHN
ncbi:hypothetical protein [Stenotrophomonas sp. S39]|nr:hypothetical protein [Stenotrophomonas sp. S39]